MSNLISRVAAATAEFCGRRPILVLGSAIIFAVISVTTAVHHLGINMDTSEMFSRNLEYRKIHEEYKSAFPGDRGRLIAVIDAPTVDLAEEAADALVVKLRSDSVFETVERPGADPFLEAHGLLFMKKNELADFGDRIMKMEPMLRKFIAGADIPGFFDPLGEALVGSQENASVRLTSSDDISKNMNSLFHELNDVFTARLEKRNASLSWKNLMSSDKLDTAERRALVSIKLRKTDDDFGSAGKAMARVRGATNELAIDASNGMRLRLTGVVALSHEEIESAASGAFQAAWLSFILVTALMYWGLRSARHVIASVITLAVGLAWTIGFTGLAIGHLNLISAAFGVLYIGLGTDYAIYFCLRYDEMARNTGESHVVVLRETASTIGPSLFLCSATTAVGFYSFVPTEYTGVAELGLIGGTGMFLSFLAAFTVLPAMMSLLSGKERPAAPIRVPSQNNFEISKLMRFMPAFTLVAAVAALILSSRIHFDYNPMNLRDPHSESVSTFRDISANSRGSQAIVFLAPDSAAARADAEKLERFATIHSAVTIHSFVPEDQAEKLGRIAEIASLLQPEFWSIQPPRRADPSDEREAVKKFARKVEEYASTHDDSAASRLATILGQYQTRLAGLSEEEGESEMGKLSSNLFASLPTTLEKLRTTLTVSSGFSVADLPNDLKAEWISLDGRERVQVLPEEGLIDNDRLNRFVSDVRSVVPRATGSPVIFVEAGRAVVRSFQWALGIAVVGTILILYVFFRRTADVMYVMLALTLSGLFTGAFSVLYGMPFNFANIIVIPLLLGIGGDHSILVVQRFRMGKTNHPDDLFKTSTSRGILFATLTTIGSLGNLGLSSHEGMASMGNLLSVALIFSVFCTLVILPTFLCRPRRSL